MSLILHPSVRLKKNKHRNLIYTVDEFFNEPNNIDPISPSMAIFLTMFDGIKPYEQVLQEFFYVTSNEDSPENKKFLEDQLRFIEKEVLRINHLLIDISERDQLGYKIVSYSPEDFIIPREEIDIRPYDKRIDFPLSINYNVSTNCSFKCRYCYHPRSKLDEYISLERLKNLFDELKMNGCENITLSGGDPFERPDLIALIKELHDRELNYFLSTKSYLDREVCQQLVDVGLTKMQISLDAADPQIASFLVGGKANYFENTIETVKNLQKLKVEVRLKAVVCNQNALFLKEYLELCRQLEVSRVHLVQYGRSLWCHNDDLFPNQEKMKIANATIDEFKAKYSSPKIIGGSYQYSIIDQTGSRNGNEDIFKDRSICNAGRFALTLLPNGEVIVCEQLGYDPEVILGDLRTQTIEELWNSEKMEKWLSPPPRETFNSDSPCYFCKGELYQKCHRMYSRCLRDSFNYFQNLNSPDIRCKLASVGNFRIS